MTNASHGRGLAKAFLKAMEGKDLSHITMRPEELRALCEAAIQDAGAGKDSKRLEFLHERLKVTIAYALKWPCVPQDIASFRAALDKEIEYVE